MPITINGSGTVTGISAGGLPDNCIVTADIADNNVTTPKVSDGAITQAKRSEQLTRETSQASTSGTSIDFPNIPSWVKRITVILNGVSTSGASNNVLLQLGDSGGVETTGYISYASTVYINLSTGVVVSTGTGRTDGFPILFGLASSIRFGAYTLYNISGNTWVATYTFGTSDAVSLAGSSQGGGNKTLSGTLDRVRLTTTGGTDTFDAGLVNIMYE